MSKVFVELHNLKQPPSEATPRTIVRYSNSKVQIAPVTPGLLPSALLLKGLFDGNWAISYIPALMHWEAFSFSALCDAKHTVSNCYEQYCSQAETYVVDCSCCVLN